MGGGEVETKMVQRTDFSAHKNKSESEVYLHLFASKCLASILMDAVQHPCITNRTLLVTKQQISLQAEKKNKKYRDATIHQYVSTGHTLTPKDALRCMLV